MIYSYKFITYSLDENFKEKTRNSKITMWLLTQDDFFLLITYHCFQLICYCQGGLLVVFGAYVGGEEVGIYWGINLDMSCPDQRLLVGNN